MVQIFITSTCVLSDVTSALKNSSRCERGLIWCCENSIACESLNVSIIAIIIIAKFWTNKIFKMQKLS